MSNLSRRSLILSGAGALCAASTTLSSANAASATSGASAPETSASPFDFALNTGTLSGFQLGIEEEIDVAAKAGYRFIEPWTHRLTDFVKKGGKLSDVKKRLDDYGMKAVNAISFFAWAVEDEGRRAAGIEQMKREMGMLREIGCPLIAATAAGATDKRLDDFAELGRRYHAILEIGETTGVIPHLEIWGPVPTFKTLSDALAVAAAAGHPKAGLLLDAYHLYRGGSSFEGLRLVSGKAMAVFHMNDYPADPPREQAQDKDRVYPGDGICPLPLILDILRANGFRGVLSFEVFNPTYWATGDPLGVARTGLEKMKAVASRDGRSSFR